MRAPSTKHAGTVVKRNTALKLKLRGLTLEQIGQHLECTHQYAWELITGALLEYEGETRENAEELRQIGHLRNEHDVGRLYMKAFPADLGADLDYRAIDRLIRIREFDARLMGYMAPEKVQFSVQQIETVFGAVCADLSRVIPDESVPVIQQVLTDNLARIAGGAEAPQSK